jgi:hypothetical protein
MRPVRTLLVGSLLALAGCGDPPPGSGVHELSPAERLARDEARFTAGEQLGLAGLERRLLALGLHREELARAIDRDYGIELVRLSIGPQRLAEIDRPALARLNLDSNYRIAFADPSAERAFAPYSGEEAFRRDQAEAIAELKRHGDWQRVPRRRGIEPMARFAQRLESWCGYESGEALHVIDGAWLEYAHEFVDGAVREAPPGRKGAQFDCLRRVVYATELRWSFIGNRGRPAG